MTSGISGLPKVVGCSRRIRQKPNRPSIQDLFATLNSDCIFKMQDEDGFATFIAHLEIMA